MAFRIGDIISNMKFGGARSAYFDISLTSPFDSELGSNISFKAQASEIPSSTIGGVQVPYFGRKINLAGDRTFDPWRINILEDEDYKIRNAFEHWHNMINTLRGNLNVTGSAEPLNYKSIGAVRQYSKADDTSPIRVYRMFGVFPTDISAIDLDWNAVNTIEQFSVTLAFDWYEIEGSTSRNIVPE